MEAWLAGYNPKTKPTKAETPKPSKIAFTEMANCHPEPTTWLKIKEAIKENFEEFEKKAGKKVAEKLKEYLK